MISISVGLGKEPAISSSTSGAPCPRLAHSSGSSANPNSYARSVHHTTPVEARVGSSPAWDLWPSCALRNCRWILELVSATGQQLLINCNTSRLLSSVSLLMGILQLTIATRLICTKPPRSPTRQSWCPCRAVHGKLAIVECHPF